MRIFTKTGRSIMTTDEKLDLQWKVRYCIGQGMTRQQTIEKLVSSGFLKGTISKYYTVFSKEAK